MFAKPKNKRRCKLLLMRGVGAGPPSAGLQAIHPAKWHPGRSDRPGSSPFYRARIGLRTSFRRRCTCLPAGTTQEAIEQSSEHKCTGQGLTAGAAACTLTAGAHTAHGTQDLNWYLLDHPSAMVTVSTCFQQYRQFSTSALHCAVAGYPPVRVRKCESGARMGGNQDIT